LGAILTLRMTAATIAPILPERQGQVKPGSYEDDRRGSVRRVPRSAAPCSLAANQC